MKNNHHKKNELETKIAQQKFFELISENEASQLVGGQFKVRLKEVGPIRRTFARAISVNPTAIKITNKSKLDLYYGIVYAGGFNNVKNAKVRAGKHTVHYALNKPAAALGWDENLAKPGMQMDIARLKPGYEYAFTVV